MQNEKKEVSNKQLHNKDLYKSHHRAAISFDQSSHLFAILLPLQMCHD